MDSMLLHYSNTILPSISSLFPRSVGIIATAAIFCILCDVEWSLIWVISTGVEKTLKKCHNFFYGETNISLKINIDTKQPTCIYQLRFSRDPHDLFNRPSVAGAVLKSASSLIHSLSKSSFS